VTDPAASSSVAAARRLVEHAAVQLAQTQHRPVAEHVDVLAGVHRALQDALAALDEV